MANVCSYCCRTFDGDGHNETNFQRHEEACKQKQERKRKVVSHPIKRFFAPISTKKFIEETAVDVDTV